MILAYRPLSLREAYNPNEPLFLRLKVAEHRLREKNIKTSLPRYTQDNLASCLPLADLAQKLGIDVYDLAAMTHRFGIPVKNYGIKPKGTDGNKHLPPLHFSGTMLFFDACPRCKAGEVELTSSNENSNLSCFQCGYRIESS